MPAAEFQNHQQLPVHERVHSIAQVAFSICLLHYISAVSAKSHMSSKLTHEYPSFSTKQKKRKVFLGNYFRKLKAICVPLAQKG
jgi:hypothetical protein